MKVTLSSQPLAIEANLLTTQSFDQYTGLWARQIRLSALAVASMQSFSHRSSGLHDRLDNVIVWREPAAVMLLHWCLHQLAEIRLVMFQAVCWHDVWRMLRHSSVGSEVGSAGVNAC